MLIILYADDRPTNFNTQYNRVSIRIACAYRHWHMSTDKISVAHCVVAVYVLHEAWSLVAEKRLPGCV